MITVYGKTVAEIMAIVIRNTIKGTTGYRAIRNAIEFWYEEPEGVYNCSVLGVTFKYNSLQQTLDISRFKEVFGINRLKMLEEELKSSESIDTSDLLIELTRLLSAEHRKNNEATYFYGKDMPELIETLYPLRGDIPIPEQSFGHSTTNKIMDKINQIIKRKQS